MNIQSEYPKFISNQPCGKDMFLGKSQERVAKAIAEHIKKKEFKIKTGKEENSLPNIIGLEGGWGSGKSNLIRILKEDFLKDTHYVFEYDAWGHQEDLQRRSFLETLTDKLVKKEILIGETTVELINGDTKSVSWKKRLDYLLARKFETETEQYPKIGYGIIIAFFTAILLPIFYYIANVSENKSYWGTIIVATPIIIALIIWVIKAWKNKKYRTLDFLLAVYQDKVTKNIEFKTISENEPSVTEFKNWMNGISEALKKENQHNLIIVFDNMDRLPAQKVKELWSSIHTFFAEVSYDNIWVIITFDRNHLANAFGKSENSKDEEEARNLTSHFINKTFPVIYRVAAPVISDLKLVFINYFDAAFGKDEILRKEKEAILRVFSIIKPNPTIRDVIAFINEITLQKMTWKEEIPLLHIAIFILTKDKIVKDENSIAENILSNNYSAGIQKLVNNEDELRESISALAYNIDKNSARQVPMTHYLRDLFNDINSTNAINTYSSHRYFVEILFDVIQDIDATLIIRTIKLMNELVIEEIKDNKKRVEEIWDYLTIQKVKQKITSFNFEREYKIILIKGNDENRKSILKYLCNGYQKNKEIDGTKYHKSMSELKKFISENKLNLDIELYLKETTITPKVFINYVESAKYEYESFKLVCDNSKLNQYLIGLLPDEMNHTTFFDYLSESSYDFTDFLKELENHIPSMTNSNFYWLNYSYKAISEKKPLEVLLNQTKIAALQPLMAEKSVKGFYDITAMALGFNIGVTVDGNDANIILELAKRIEYYHSYGPLLKSSITWNNPVLNKVLRELTTNSQGLSRATLTEILPHFEQILSVLNIESDILLTRLNGWYESAEKDINKENIEQFILYTFYSHSILTKNKLTTHIHNTAKERLAEIDPNVIFQQRDQPAYYWLVVAKKLIDGKKLIALTDNLVEFVKKVFIDISTSGTKPNEIVTTIIKKVAPSKITATIKDIGTEYYSGRKVINAQMFIFFESYFRERNRIKGHEGDYTRTVLKTMFSNAECKSLIMAHKGFYIEVVKAAGDDAENFKIMIKDLCQSQPNDELNKFAQQIGVKEDKEQNE